MISSLEGAAAGRRSWRHLTKTGRPRERLVIWLVGHRRQHKICPGALCRPVWQEPVECMRRPMQNNSAAEQPVYDPFLGSGTTLIAAETIGEARFVDVAVRRWEAFTGKEAKRS